MKNDVIVKVRELMDAPSCCAEAKAACAAVEQILERKEDIL